MGIGHLILPDQLNAEQVKSCKGRKVLIVEHPRFFWHPEDGIRFHKKKLVLHRASMKFLQKTLLHQGIDSIYIDHAEALGEGLFPLLAEENIRELSMIIPNDIPLRSEISQGASEEAIDLTYIPSPSFILPEERIEKLFAGKDHLSMTSMYIEERKRSGILIEEGRPIGGKWSFDRENRRPMPRGTVIPKLPTSSDGETVEEAKSYVNREFEDHPGDTDGFIFPITREGALSWMKDFMDNRLNRFGDYQDAISSSEPFLFHSLLSPCLNIGLLTPSEVIGNALEARGAPINSLEGFVRQVMGWREFVRAVYLVAGEKERSSNFWNNQRELPSFFYTASSGLPPLDIVIERTIRNAYAHHIERLMILGNFMLLIDLHPHEVYRWFMEMFIDAFDWVMVPNVYGMSQYADGGLMATKPYISSSNYIRRMSDFDRGEWCDIWDSLFWRFINRHRKAIASNPRMAIMVKNLDRMERGRMKAHLDTAEEYLEGI